MYAERLGSKPTQSVRHVQPRQRAPRTRVAGRYGTQGAWPKLEAWDLTTCLRAMQHVLGHEAGMTMSKMQADVRVREYADSADFIDFFISAQVEPRGYSSDLTPEPLWRDMARWFVETPSIPGQGRGSYSPSHGLLAAIGFDAANRAHHDDLKFFMFLADKASRIHGFALSGTIHIHQGAAAGYPLLHEALHTVSNVGLCNSGINEGITDWFAVEIIRQTTGENYQAHYEDEFEIVDILMKAGYRGALARLYFGRDANPICQQMGAHAWYALRMAVMREEFWVARIIAAHSAGDVWRLSSVVPDYYKRLPREHMQQLDIDALLQLQHRPPSQASERAKNSPHSGC